MSSKKTRHYKTPDGYTIDANDEFYIEHPNSILSSTGTEFLAATAKSRGTRTAMPHLHESIEFLYITEGCFDIFINDKELLAFEGDLVMFPSNSIHHVYSAGDGSNSYMCMKINPSILLDMASPERGVSYAMRFIIHGDYKLSWTRKELEGTQLLDAVNTVIREVAPTKSFSIPSGKMHVHMKNNPLVIAQDVAVKTAMVSLLVAILRFDSAHNVNSDTARTAVPATYQIYKAMTYINCHYAENITAESCADYVCMSYSYFSRSFKSVTGKSFSRYLNEVRINHAEHELLMTDKSVTEICYGCGFGDVSYFIARYKAARGKTPYQHRKEMP